MWRTKANSNGYNDFVSRGNKIKPGASSILVARETWNDVDSRNTSNGRHSGY
jgi:hypothetical protein